MHPLLFALIITGNIIGLWWFLNDVADSLEVVLRSAKQERRNENKF